MVGIIVPANPAKVSLVVLLAVFHFAAVLFVALMRAVIGILILAIFAKMLGVLNWTPWNSAFIRVPLNVRPVITCHGPSSLTFSRKMIGVGIVAMLAIVFVMSFFTALDSTGVLSSPKMISIELLAISREMIRVRAMTVLAVVGSVIFLAP